MIINVRGTHGSGKSTLVRRVLEQYREEQKAHGDNYGVIPWKIDGRKRPFGYHCRGRNFAPLLILGSYETPTGGCDTISQIEMIFGAVEMAAETGGNVLFEGIVAQHSATRLLDLNKKHPVDVIVLTTPQEVAVESVRSRRAERGASVEEFDPKNVIKEYKSVLSSSRRLEGNGMTLHKLDREAGFLFVLSKLSAETQQAVG